VQLSLRVLGLMAYWYTGSAFHQIPQSYLEIIPAVIYRQISHIGFPFNSAEE